MGNSDQDSKELEIARLQEALDAETRRCLDIQRQLDRAGADFEKFVSILAHNLREPLRDVASFSQLLAETNASRLDGDAGEFLERIREGAATMQAMLADVVDYWAADTYDRQFSRTDMEAVLHQALLWKDQQIQERNAAITHDLLPPVCGDFETLARVMRHLIRNALEFCGPSPRIHISSRREDFDLVFSVEDNGPGIDVAFRDRIFEPFKRLHGRDYPGNGLGLAFCKKAIERHGGRMWMESTPGAGSTFYFTLPAAD